MSLIYNKIHSYLDAG